MWTNTERRPEKTLSPSVLIQRICTSIHHTNLAWTMHIKIWKSSIGEQTDYIGGLEENIQLKNKTGSKQKDSQSSVARTLLCRPAQKWLGKTMLVQVLIQKIVPPFMTPNSLKHAQKMLEIDHCWTNPDYIKWLKDKHMTWKKDRHQTINILS